MNGFIGSLSTGDVDLKESIVHLYSIYMCFDAPILSSTLSK